MRNSCEATDFACFSYLIRKFRWFGSISMFDAYLLVFALVYSYATKIDQVIPNENKKSRQILVYCCPFLVSTKKDTRIDLFYFINENQIRLCYCLKEGQ